MSDFVDLLPEKIVGRIFGLLPVKVRCKVEGVSKTWHSVIQETYVKDVKQIWLYTIFRKDRLGGHDNMSVIFSYHGPVFWGRQIVYINVCCCHFHDHEIAYKSICRKLGKQVNRICLVDSPIHLPYLTDEFYRYMLDLMPRLEWIYLREIDLETISGTTVQRLASHPTLKKIVAHWCRNYEALQSYGTLKSLMICNMQIEGLKYLEEIDEHLSRQLTMANEYDLKEDA